jgi:hypothetical protein
MVSEDNVVFDPYNVVLIIWVILLQVLENFDLDLSLVLELLLIPNDL